MYGYWIRSLETISLQLINLLPLFSLSKQKAPAMNCGGPRDKAKVSKCRTQWPSPESYLRKRRAGR